MGAISSRTAGGTQTLQGVYDRSSPPEVLINSSLGSVIFGIGSDAANTDNLLEFQNKSGTLRGYIRGDGLASFTSIAYDPTTPNDWTGLGATAPDDVFEALDSLANWAVNFVGGFVLQDGTTSAVYTNNLPTGISGTDLGNDSLDLQSERAAGDYCAADDSVAIGRGVEINETGGGVGSNLGLGNAITITQGISGANIAVGSGIAIASGISNVIVFGRSVSIPNPGSQAVIIGSQGSFGGDIENSVGIGHAVGARDSTVAVGAIANPTGNNAICIGRDTTAPQNSVAIGRGATASSSNQFMIGAASRRLNVWITGNNSATSTTTGALIVEGGVGIGESLYIGDVTGTAVNLLGVDASGKVIDTGLAISGGLLDKYTTDIGDNSNTAFVVNHSLNTLDVTVTVYSNVSFDIEYPTITIDDVNNITVTFDSPPTVNEYRVIVIG